jgi:hypothetical protein
MITAQVGGRSLGFSPLAPTMQAEQDSTVSWMGLVTQRTVGMWVW